MEFLLPPDLYRANSLAICYFGSSTIQILCAIKNLAKTLQKTRIQAIVNALSHTCAHNHRHSTMDIMAEAEACCTKSGLRLTEQRRAILRLLAGSDKPLGAYDLLEMTQKASAKRQAPVAIYRALDFLLQARLIHRIESKNAFIICPHPHEEDEAVIFLICETCGHVDEAMSSAVEISLSHLSDKRGFRSTTRMIELSGICAACSSGNQST